MDIDAFNFDRELDEMEDEEWEEEQLLAGTATAMIVLGMVEAHRLRTNDANQAASIFVAPSCFEILVGSLHGRSSIGAGAMTAHNGTTTTAADACYVTGSSTIPSHLVCGLINPVNSGDEEALYGRVVYLMTTRPAPGKRAQEHDPLMNPELLAYFSIT
ncbi:hypothetical protein B0H12DRAFT_1234628 [Mycena haematopus]|nr:hypothetical protein B0H12DRAFT_1234628 [Mycena haematopus]